MDCTWVNLKIFGPAFFKFNETINNQLTGRSAVGQQVIAAGMRSCAIAVLFALVVFALPFVLSPCLGFAPLFRRFIRLLLVRNCSGVFAPCSFHFIAVSSAVMPPRCTRNSLESSVLPAVSSAPPSTISVSTNAILTSAQASRSPTCTSPSISPEFLAEMIQAIQTPISAIVQQSLSAVVGAHSVSQGLPAISAQASSLVTRAVHLGARGSHQPWSSSAAAGFLPSTSSSSSRPVLLQYQWLRQRTYRQVCCRLLSSLLSLLFFLRLPCPP